MQILVWTIAIWNQVSLRCWNIFLSNITHGSQQKETLHFDIKYHNFKHHVHLFWFPVLIVDCNFRRLHTVENDLMVRDGQKLTWSELHFVMGSNTTLTMPLYSWIIYHHFQSNVSNIYWRFHFDAKICFNEIRSHCWRLKETSHFNN